jgi:hypothetical protein
VSDSLRWRKSRRSAQGNCVEVAWHDGRVLVRDTQDHIGPVLRFSLAAWRRFAGQVKRPLASGPAEGPDRRECVQGALWCLGALSSLCLELFPRWPGSAGIRVSARRCAGFLLCRGRRGRRVVAGARSAPSGLAVSVLSRAAGRGGRVGVPDVEPPGPDRVGGQAPGRRSEVDRRFDGQAAGGVGVCRVGGVPSLVDARQLM